MGLKTVVLNSERMNYDGKLDLSVLSSEVKEYASTEQDQILERVQGMDVVVTKEMPVDGDTIARFPDSVQLICEAGTGYNNIDIEAARARGITVCNIPAYSTERVAHTAIMMILNLSSSMQIQQAMLARGDRSNFTKCMQVSHVEVNGKVLGIVGAGNIGREVIKVAQALGMKVLAYVRTPRADEDNLKYVSFEELLKQSDYISLHCPLTPQTRHMINKETIAMMKPTAYIINTGRGALIDEPALIEALKEGRIAGAGLDVQETEPPVQDNPLYDMPNVILTPHIGEMSRLCVRTISEIQGTIAQTAVDYAKETGTVCVLKDACTVITDGKGDLYLNLSGNSGMATAGSGDVLSGLLAGVLCMYLKTEEHPSMVLKAALGVYLHGLCGDLAAAEKGKRSMLAGDIIEYLPQALAIGEEESKS